MNKTIKITLGLALIAVGVIWALVTLDIINFSFSTEGWWALFIIIPCLYNLLTGKDKGGAAIAIGIGVNLVFFNSWEKSRQVEIETIDKEGRQIKSIAINFGKQDVSFAGERFEGAVSRA